jgi:hypothetical protein
MGADAAVTPGVGARPDGGTSERWADVASSTGFAADAPVERARSEAGAPPETPTARPPRPGELAIDELLVDPTGNDLGHEWIEIANLAQEPLDLGALRIADDATEVAVDAGVLAAGGLLVLGQSADRAHNGDAPVDVAYGTKLSLNNGADRIALCAGPCASGLQLDAVAWTAPWGEDYVGHAVEIERGGVACPAEEPYGASGNFGSPGRANPPCPARDAGAHVDVDMGSGDADGAGDR